MSSHDFTRYEQLIVHAPIGVFALNHEGRYIYANPHVCEMTGYALEELLQMTPLDFMHPDDRDIGEAELQTFLTHKKIDYTGPFRHKDGTSIWLRIVGSEIDGLLFGYVSNVTDHIESQKQLSLRQKIAKLALKASDSGVWIWNTANNDVFFNDRWFSMLGYDPKELPMTAATWNNLIHPDDRDEARRLLYETAATGKFHEMRIRMRSKNGSWMWLLSKGKLVEPLPDGKGVRVAGTHTDIDEQVVVETELEVKRRHMEQAIMASGAGLWDRNLVTGEIFASEKCYTMLGYEPNEYKITPEVWLGLMHPDEREQTLKNIQQSIDSGEPYFLRYRMKCKDGSWKWVQARGNITERDENGRPTHLAGSYLDIDQQVKTEEKLKASEERLHLAMLSTKDGLWDWYPLSGETYFSSQWYAMLGYENQELPMTYESWEKLVHPDDLDAVLKTITDHLKSGEAFSERYRIRCRNGDWKWILDRGQSAEWNDEGLCTRMTGVHTDIDEQVKVELLLKQSEERYRMLFQNANDGILLMDHERFIQCNPYAAWLYGCTEEELLAGTPIDFSPPFQDDGQPSDEKAMAMINRAMQGERITFEWLHNKLNGELFYAAVTLSHVQLLSKDYVLAIVRDVTERKDYEKKLAYSEHRWRMAMEQSPYPTITFTTEGVVESANHAWYELWDYDTDKITPIGYNIFKDNLLATNEVRNSVEKARHGQSSYYPKSFYDPSSEGYEGRARYINTWVYPLHDDSGAVNTVVVIHRDITQQVEDAENERKQSDLFERMRRTVLAVATHPALHNGDLEKLAEFALPRVREIIGADRCSYWEYINADKLVAQQSVVVDDSVPSTTGEALYTQNYPHYHAALLAERAIAADDILTHPHTIELTDDYSAPYQAKSLLDSPIRMGLTLGGVVSLEFCTEQHRWTPYEINFGAELADQFAQAMQNRQRRRQESLRKCLYRIAHASEALATLQELFRALYHILQSATSIEQMDILLVEENETRLTRQFFASRNQKGSTSLAIAEAIGKTVLDTGDSILYNEPALHLEPEIRDVFRNLSAGSAIAQPLRTGDTVFGVLLLQESDSSRPYNQSDVMLLQFVATEIAHAISKKKAEREIQEHQQRLSLAVEGGNLGLWDWRIDEDTVIFDTHWRNILGFNEHELGTKMSDWESLLHPDDRLDVLDTIQLHLHGETSLFEEIFRMRRKTGEYIWVQARGKVVERSESGAPIRAAGAYVDISERKRAQTDRDRLFNLSLDMFCIVSFDGFFKQLNPSWARTLGWSKQELSERPLIEFSHPDDREKLVSAIDRLTHGQPVLFLESKFLCKDGSYSWLSWNAFPAPEDKLFFAVVRDISDSIQAKITLKESEETYRTIIEATPLGVFSYDLVDNELTLASVNSAANSLLGADYSLHLGKTITDIFPFYAETDLLEHYAKVAREGGLYHREFFEHPTEAGDKLFELYAFQPKPDSTSVMFLDITERMRAEEEARQLRNLLRNIVDSMPSALVGLDSEGKVTQWNTQAEQFTGVAAESAHGRPIVDVVPQLGFDYQRISDSIRSRSVTFEPKRAININGEKRFADFTVYPLISNGIDGAVIRIDDVTERLRIEEMMVQSEKMLTVGGLAAGMAHEINNPLAGIMQNVQVMHNRLFGNLKKNEDVAAEVGITLEKLRLYLERRDIPMMINGVIESGARATRIVRNMLDFSRKSEHQHAEYSMAEIVDSALELASNDYDLKKQYDFRQIDIVKEFADDLPNVMCDRSMIQQVLLNVFKNGAQAMAHNAMLHDLKPCLNISLAKAQGMLELRISDNGPGMNEETRRRIFEPFFTTKEVGQGTGLGLSVSYFIITENHKGHMDVESMVGKGATFIIRLPLGGGGENENDTRA